MPLKCVSVLNSVHSLLASYTLYAFLHSGIISTLKKIPHWRVLVYLISPCGASSVLQLSLKLLSLGSWSYLSWGSGSDSWYYRSYDFWKVVKQNKVYVEYLKLAYRLCVIFIPLLRCSVLEGPVEGCPCFTNEDHSSAFVFLHHC